jgi:hypothetical protein
MSAAGPPEHQWMEEMSRRIGSVLLSVSGQSEMGDGDSSLYPLPEGPAPNWFLLPIWLDEAWAGQGAKPLPAGALADVLWAQYALFLHIRIHDDLLDRQRDDLRLLFVADRFLVESWESLQRFDRLDQSFWNLYRQWLGETVDGILRVRDLEEVRGQFKEEHLDLHAQVGAIFKVGAAAICHLQGRGQEMAWLSRVLDRLAVFSQICDDLQDLLPDVQDGRYTWVANALLGVETGEPSVPAESARLVGAGLMHPERGWVITEELRRLSRAAADELPPSAPRRLRDLVQGLELRVDGLEQEMHEARVRWVFQDLLPQRP